MFVKIFSETHPIASLKILGEHALNPFSMLCAMQLFHYFEKYKKKT